MQHEASDRTAFRRAVFLDKDGTLVENVPYNVEPSAIQLTRNAGRALRRLADEGYALIVISNQPGIAQQRFDFASLERARVHLAGLLASEGVHLDGFYFCPHHPDGSWAEYAYRCACRKPMPGLFLRAARELEIDLSASWMIGDILDDIEAARRAGCRAVLLDIGNETEWLVGELRVPHGRASDLDQAARLICDEGREENRCAQCGQDPHAQSALGAA